jgi:nucleotide-binding universal stress UspA family protein
MIEIKNILFPFDLRESSLKLLPYVVSISEKYNSVICLLHVIEDISKWGGFYIPHIPLELYQQEAEQAAEKFMEKICEQKLKGNTKLKKMVLSGDPGTEILKTIESEPIDLVIMGTHGFKGLERRIFGSVAERVVKESAAPVLVINPNKLK